MTTTNMLTSFNGLCHRVLRDEKGLVYSANPCLYPNLGFMYIKAKISVENKDKCLEGIDEIIDRLTDYSEVETYLNWFKEKQIEKYECLGETLKDNITLMNNYLFETKPMPDEYLENLNKLKPEDIIAENKKLVKKYTYFLRGTKKC